MNKELIKTFSYRISQASRSDLVVILYDMAIEYIKVATVSDNPEYSESIKQCGRVIDQLIKGLDFQYDMSNDLFKIYIYIKRTLVKCMAKKDENRLNHVSGMLKKLRNSFYEISKTDKSEPLMKNTQQVYAGLTYSSMGNSNEISHNDINRGFKV